MLCAYCKMERAADDTPCLQCGSPSPLLLPGSGALQAPSTPLSSQQPSTVPLSPQAQPAAPSLPSASSQEMSPAASPSQPLQLSPSAPSPSQGPQSLLPVPYHSPDQQQSMLSMLATTHGNGLMLPGLPGDDSIVYIPPIYTKSRPVIPRYRAISGLVSIFIVALLLCTGVGYYARASGKLEAFGQLAGIILPHNVQPTPTLRLSTPPLALSFGPAYKIITSATTTSQINSQSHIAVRAENAFVIGQTFYLTYSVQSPPSAGTVVIKWYMNSSQYKTIATSPISVSVNGYASMAYQQPAEGMVELYWNDQLAIRLYFVVRGS